jgi:hypothetical protein
MPKAYVGGDSSNRSFHVGKADMKTSSRLRHFQWRNLQPKIMWRFHRHIIYHSSLFQPTLSRQPHLPTSLAGVVGASIKENVTAKLSHFLPHSSTKKDSASSDAESLPLPHPKKKPAPNGAGFSPLIILFNLRHLQCRKLLLTETKL